LNLDPAVGVDAEAQRLVGVMVVLQRRGQMPNLGSTAS